MSTEVFVMDGWISEPKGSFSKGAVRHRLTEVSPSPYNIAVIFTIPVGACIARPPLSINPRQGFALPPPLEKGALGVLLNYKSQSHKAPFPKELSAAG